jgi:hypothetical protein
MPNIKLPLTKLCSANTPFSIAHNKLIFFEFNISIVFSLKNGADDEIRTHDIHVGNVMLYQLSYIRKKWWGWRDLNPHATFSF